MSDEAKLDEVSKYRFTKLRDDRYPSGYAEGQVVELAYRHAVGCPWWVPVVEASDVVGISEAVCVEKSGTPFPQVEGEPGLNAEESSERNVPDAVALMFPQRNKPKKKGA